MGQGIFGIGLDGFGKEINGEVIFTQLEADCAQQMQGHGLVGVGLQDMMQYLLKDVLGPGHKTQSGVALSQFYGLVQIKGLFPRG